MSTLAAFGEYIVFIDESGDHGLMSIDPEFPLFVLVFVIVEKAAYLQRVVPAMKALKFDFWGHDTVVLHAHEIRKPRGDFSFLQIRERREKFLAALNGLVAGMPITIVAAAIDKLQLAQRYKSPFNPYHVALGLCMERTNRFLRAHGQEGRLTHLIAEARGEREDAELELEFRRVMDGQGLLPYRTDGTPFEMRITSKKINSEGLQLADLVAHPIGRHILKPDQPNRAFEILRSKFLTNAEGEFAGWGLKIFP
ncbi:DUF3800 domain-containing protein [Radicibacter daui]|uniref:DUF3800 domain-containing protein n=1 Tax=Radicibacter daui TaxID=3064829 RepID=UPI004046BCAD